MVHSSKKLPCGHIFHTACLRSWFQRQQTCPTCRLNILRTTSRPATANIPNDPNANQPNPVLADANPIPGIPNNLPPGPNPFANLIPPGIPPSGAIFNPPPFTYPPFPMLPPFMMPPPMPPNLDTLTDEELRVLEGNERRNIEARIKLLRNIQLMLDASVTLMNQYSAISANFVTNVPSATPASDASVEAETVNEAAKTNIKPKISSPTPDNLPSTSADAKQRIAEDVKIEDLGSDEHDEIRNINSAERSESAELRRRRLQKFLQTEQNKE